MITLATNSNNDLFASNGNIVVCRDINALGQQCEKTVKVVIGELIFDLTRGVLGFGQDDIFGDTPDAQLYEFRLRDAIRAVNGVVEILSIDYEVVGDVLKYTAEIQTIYGITDFNSELFI